MDDSGDEWRASIEAEQDDDGLFCRILAITKFMTDSEEVTRVKLSGVYRSAEEAIVAGRETSRAMAQNG